MEGVPVEQAQQVKTTEPPLVPPADASTSEQAPAATSSLLESLLQGQSDDEVGGKKKKKKKKAKTGRQKELVNAMCGLFAHPSMFFSLLSGSIDQRNQGDLGDAREVECRLRAHSFAFVRPEEGSAKCVLLTGQIQSGLVVLRTISTR